MKEIEKHVAESPWSNLTEHTRARIALGRTGVSLPTRAHLEFLLDHARARDAVHLEFDAHRIAREISDATALETIIAESAAHDKTEYLRRSDLGRKLSTSSRERFQKTLTDAKCDICLTVSDGLSAQAIHDNVVPFLSDFIEKCKPDHFSFSPITVVSLGRVAIADEIAERFGAKLSVMLIGERPGLKSPNSMGIYLTYDPRIGTTDERRNCISNVRAEGLKYTAASDKLHYLVKKAFAGKISGVLLKDEQTAHSLIN